MFDPLGLSEHLLGLFKDGIQQLIVSQEQHRNGGHHFHVYLDVGRVVPVTTCRLFDYSTRHCNIKRVNQTPEKVVKYVCKDGNIVFDFDKRVADEFLRLSAIGTAI